MADAFVYCWTDIKESKLYVGWHKGTPDDGYVCSSKVLQEQYIKRPNDFTRTIIATGTVSDMVSLESAILKADGAATNHNYYNMHNNSVATGSGSVNNKLIPLPLHLHQY